MLKIATFRLDDCLFGFDAAYIEDLGVPPGSIKKIPHSAPQYFDLVTQLEDGRLIHIINTEKLLGIKAAPISANSRLLVLKSSGSKMGLLVDFYDKLLESPEEAIMPHLPITCINSRYIKGILAQGGSIVVVLNIAAVMQTLGEENP